MLHKTNRRSVAGKPSILLSHQEGGSPLATESTVILFLFIGLLILQALPALLRPAEFIQDDSYFYLQIARNIVEGRGSTFHGLMPTNGYHPLWMVGTVAAVWMVSGGMTAALYTVVALQLVLALITTLLFLRLARDMGFEARLLGAATLLAYLLGTGVYGSEAHLNALTLTAGLLTLWHALGSDRAAPWLATGIVFGLAILARLDNLFIAACLVGLGVLHDRRGNTSSVALRAAAAAAGAAIVLGPYLAHNALHFGHLMPISGAIKSTFPAFDFEVGRLGTMGKLAAASGLLSLVVGSVLDRDRRRRVIWLGTGAGTVLHALYVAGFTDHYTFWAWYYVNGVIAAALAAAYLPGWVSDRLPQHARRTVARQLTLGLMCVVLLGGAARAYVKAFNPLRFGPLTIDWPINQYRWPEEFAVWMKDHLPGDSIVLVRDWPGALAYYSDLTIVPMDGLVNDFQYNDDLLTLGARRYLCDRGFDYYFGLPDEVNPARGVRVYAPLYRKPAGTLPLFEEDMVVRVRDVVDRPDDAWPFAVWSLRCPAV